jgi:hypothetical protein
LATITSSRHVPRGPGCRRLKFDPVADDGDVRGLPLALHAAAKLRLDEVAVIGLDGVEAGAGAKDESVRRRQPSGPTVIW